MNTITAAADYLGVDSELIVGMNRKLKAGVHINKKLNPNGGYYTHYTDAGKSKLKANYEELKHLKGKIQGLFTKYSGYGSLGKRKHKAIIVKTGIAVALREMNYTKYEIAFLMDKHRTTFYNTFRNYDNGSFPKWDRQDIEDYKEITIMLINGVNNAN